MNSIKSLLTAYFNEYNKSKKSSIYWFSLLAPLSLVGIFFLAYFFKYEHFIPKAGINPWVNFVSSNITNTGFMLLPFYVILVSALYSQIEHKQNMYKQLNILPVDKSSIHFAKVSFLISLIVLTMVYFVIMLLVCGYTLGMIHPELKFLNYSPDWAEIISAVTKLFISTLGYMTIQLWLSMRFKNIIVPLGIGLALYIGSAIAIQGWDKIIYFPYAHSMIAVISSDRGMGLPGAQNIYLYSLIYFSILSVLSYFDLRKVQIK